jgi:RNA polymerase I-specific transcription initiation factor RRN7
VLGLKYSYPEVSIRHRVTAWPEVQLISIIVIAAKLSQPFDNVERTPQSMADPSTLSINWEVWLKSFDEVLTHSLRRGDEVKVTDDDIFKMDKTKLDEYLNWYQMVWIDDSDPKSKAL